MKIFILAVALCFATFISCKKTDTTIISTTNDSLATTQANNAENTPMSTNFDLSTLPESTADTGEFPYYSLPDWIDKDTSFGSDRSSDFGKLEVYTGNGFTAIEGNVISKSFRMLDPNNPGNSRWDEYKFTQSFSRHFESLGAKKIWEGKIPQEVKDELNKKNNRDNYFYTFGTPHQENLIVYGMKKEGKPVLFVISTNSAAGTISVAQDGEIKQDIGIIKSDQIHKDLSEKGKAVLHINFDTDKATLKTDGTAAVAEIAKVLKNDASLKLEINGYTDNTGNEAHNLQLSKYRAEAVKNALGQAGIDENRLTSNGFGAQNSIANNSTEEGKAQNKRVELIKK